MFYNWNNVLLQRLVSNIGKKQKVKTACLKTVELKENPLNDFTLKAKIEKERCFAILHSIIPCLFESWQNIVYN